MRNQRLRVALKGGGHGCDRHALLYCLDCTDGVAHGKVALAGHQQLHAVDLWTAHLDGHIQTVFLIQAGGLGLIEPTVFGLGIPVGTEYDFVQLGRHQGCGQTAGKHRAGHAEQCRRLQILAGVAHVLLLACSR